MSVNHQGKLRSTISFLRRVLCKSRRHRFLYYLSFFNSGLVFFLGILYVTIGDRWTWSEYLTIWPSVLWLFVLIPLVLASWDRRKLRPFCIQIFLLLTFVLATTEWTPLVRLLDKPAIARWEIARTAPETDCVALRVITWNLSGQSWTSAAIREKLAPLAPDLCFFQETRDDEPVDGNERPEQWRDYYWVDGGDCGLLSRFPLRTLPSKRIGPWSPPQIALVDMSQNRKLLAINVRLMLPSLVINPLNRRNRIRLTEDHQSRKNQYPALAKLIEETLTEQSLEQAILAGDFNTSAGSHSIRPMQKWLRDAWHLKGRGWGRTMTNEFPVARIDQVWITPGIEAVDGRVIEGSPSDHRLVIMDLIVMSDQSEPVLRNGTR